jgi:hypothetical protein
VTSFTQTNKHGYKYKLANKAMLPAHVPKPKNKKKKKTLKPSVSIGLGFF